MHYRFEERVVLCKKILVAYLYFHFTAHIIITCDNGTPIVIFHYIFEVIPVYSYILFNSVNFYVAINMHIFGFVLINNEANLFWFFSNCYEHLKSFSSIGHPNTLESFRWYGDKPSPCFCSLLMENVSLMCLSFFGLLCFLMPPKHWQQKSIWQKSQAYDSLWKALWKSLDIWEWNRKKNLSRNIGYYFKPGDMYNIREACGMEDVRKPDATQ